jgi:tetratricopeptide (TPR) repeat protein
MYGFLAEIALTEGEYSLAGEYAEQAKASGAELSRRYNYFKAHILLAENKNEEALELFDTFYRVQPDLMAPKDIRAYMYLLAQAERNTEAAVIVDLFLKTGSFFTGLGVFASSVYEAAGEFQKSIYAAFLEYEYYAAYKASDPLVFLNNVTTLEGHFARQGTLEETQRRAIQFIRGAFDPSVSSPALGNTPFFVEEYISVKNKIRDASVTLADFNRFLQLESYFSQFPVYYWNVWQAVLILDQGKSNEEKFVPVLQKIITLDKNGIYAKPAWDEITRILGFS